MTEESIFRFRYRDGGASVFNVQDGNQRYEVIYI